MTELKPCPFCGYKTNRSPMMIKEKDYDANIFDNEEKCRKAEVWFHLVCLRCKSKTDEYSSEEKVIEAWNRRVRDEE